MYPKKLEVSDLQWRTARRSAGNGACVQVAPANGQIAIRDSKDPDGPTLNYPVRAFRLFLDATKNGSTPS